MQIYEYYCDPCENSFEALSTVADRKVAACPRCKGAGQHVLTPVRIDETKMGQDPGFPSAHDKLGRKFRARMSGKTADSLNKMLTHVDIDRVTWDAKKKG